MGINEYQQAALVTENKETAQHLRIVNGVLGLVGESGECADMIKKHVFQGHELDNEHLAKELGDICWYIAIAADAIGYNLETIMQMNVDKLRKRYPEGFDVDKSLNRAENDI